MPPPKLAKQEKKKEITLIRLPISDASLVFVPSNAIEGFQERIETGVEWVLTEQALRHHKALGGREHIPKVSFSKALKNKIENSIIGEFLDNKSSLTLRQHWEVTLPMTIFDIHKCANEEGKICYNSDNCITDNPKDLIKNAVIANSRKVLKQDFKKILVLRVIDAKITHLDNSIAKFPFLVTLNLCGNYIDALDTFFLPRNLRILELQANRISNLESFYNLPENLLYLGLAKNLLANASGLDILSRLSPHISAIDLSDNDIYDLEAVIEPLTKLQTLQSLVLAGNPCAMCLGYARFIITKMPGLKYLDNREIMLTNRPEEPYEPHPDDLRSTYFLFTVIRIISAPLPPKVDKGVIATFHVELELPLLDSQRRMFLMFRRNGSLTELMPAPEDDNTSDHDDKNIIENESASDETTGDIFARLEAKNSREIHHYTTYESNKIPWNKIMNFQEPTVKIFCPDLTAVRNTFRSVITVRFIYSLQTPSVKLDKKLDKKDKTSTIKSRPKEMRATIASIKCALRPCDWSQPAQHFHWDDTLNTNEAVHWGDGDLSAVQYYAQGVTNKPQKGKPESDVTSKQVAPENLTCHFSFGVESFRIPDQ
ncbi:uncharacterized protein LOC113233601 [Hyposmocoma kahamanoa]|uniref:uncharacterized protein LOC113233601 n=1 Tax=Hyposmocoma kahamanoa TaxID=1477025 RepID=UPI000E6D9E71|nr:uncharacterized protein LOC113233601 [Hyposmocoma kahamanoa]